MTSVTKTIKRLSTATVRSGGKMREIVIELTPPGAEITFRLKGTRQSYSLPVGFCFTKAVEVHIREEKARKAALRKAKRDA